MINEFTFKIKVKDCDEIFEQIVIVKPDPADLCEITLQPICHQRLFLNNYLNTPKAEIEQHLFSLVKKQFVKAFQRNYNDETITSKSIYSYENEYYCLTSNINEIDNYQETKNILITIESLQPEILTGKIETSINVQGITKSLTDIQYLFHIEDKVLSNNKDKIDVLINNQFKMWMEEQYNISLIDDDFELTYDIITAENITQKIVNVTISANEQMQTKISDQFSVNLEIRTPAYDISNLKLNCTKQVNCQYQQQITKLQLCQFLLPIIKNEIINVIKEQEKLAIEQYKDFWLDINAPEVDTYQDEKIIKVVINTTNNKRLFSLYVLFLNFIT